MHGRGLADSRWAARSPGRRNSFHFSPQPSATPSTWPGLAITITPSSATTPISSITTPQPATLTATTAANTTAPVTTTSNKTLSAAQELVRYTKIVRRLQWKLPYLAAGYHRATAIEEGGMPMESWAESRAEAELMFKLDFFEYYMLLERALVHLLGVFDIVISNGRGQQQQEPHHAQNGKTDGNGYSNGHVHGNGQSHWVPSAHRYHHNVLAALDSEDNPLHVVLGTGEVRVCLVRAKNLRNRWKYADEDEGDRGGATARVSLPLRSYDLEAMLQQIFDGFDLGYRIAEARVAEGRRLHLMNEGDVNGDGTGTGLAGKEVEEDQWDFMVDAMDWEAV
jgi:hypothetical protein